MNKFIIPRSLDLPINTINALWGILRSIRERRLFSLDMEVVWCALHAIDLPGMSSYIEDMVQWIAKDQGDEGYTYELQWYSGCAKALLQRHKAIGTTIQLELAWSCISILMGMQKVKSVLDIANHSLWSLNDYYHQVGRDEGDNTIYERHYNSFIGPVSTLKTIACVQQDRSFWKSLWTEGVHHDRDWPIMVVEHKSAIWYYYNEGTDLCEKWIAGTPNGYSTVMWKAPTTYVIDVDIDEESGTWL